MLHSVFVIIFVFQTLSNIRTNSYWNYFHISVSDLVSQNCKQNLAYRKNQAVSPQSCLYIDNKKTFPAEPGHFHFSY